MQDASWKSCFRQQRRNFSAAATNPWRQSPREQQHLCSIPRTVLGDIEEGSLPTLITRLESSVGTPSMLQVRLSCWEPGRTVKSMLSPRSMTCSNTPCSYVANAETTSRGHALLQAVLT